MLREAFALPSLDVHGHPGGDELRRPPGLAHAAARRARRSCSSATTTPCSRRATSRAGARTAAARRPGRARHEGRARGDPRARSPRSTRPARSRRCRSRSSASPTRRSARRRSTPHLARARDGRARARSCSRRAAPADAIITRRKGVGAMTVIAHGKAAHAGNNHKDGANAIWALARFVDAAQRSPTTRAASPSTSGSSPAARRRTPCPSAPSACSTCASRPSPTPSALVGELRAAAAAAAASPGVRIEVHGRRRTGCRSSARRRRPRCATSTRRARARRGSATARPRCSAAARDANTVAPLGVPAIDGLGPRGAGFHTTTEYVELATFVPKAEALVRFLWGRRV